MLDRDITHPHQRAIDLIAGEKFGEFCVATYVEDDAAVRINGRILRMRNVGKKTVRDLVDRFKAADLRVFIGPEFL